METIERERRQVMDKNISEIYNFIQDLSWYFGNQGFDGTCCGDLTLVEYMTLKKIQDNKECAIQEIGNALNITKSGTSKIIDRLENKGYVIKKKAPIDGRVCCVAPTEKGLKAIKGISVVYTSYLDEALKTYNAKEIDDMKNIMQNLLASVQKQGFIKMK